MIPSRVILLPLAHPHPLYANRAAKSDLAAVLEAAVAARLVSLEQAVQAVEPSARDLRHSSVSVKVMGDGDAIWSQNNKTRAKLNEKGNLPSPKRPQGHTAATLWCQ